MATAVYARPPLTYQEYRLLPEDGKRYELMEGDLFVSPAPSPWHQTVSGRMLHMLMTQLQDSGLARVFPAPIDLVLEPESVVQPDLVQVGRARKHIVTERAIEGAPDVVVEILSPGSRDRDKHIKRRLYERFAIPEYWVVDPDLGRIEIWRIEAGRYGIRAQLDRASTLTSPDFPELSIPLLPLFQQA